MTGIEQHPQDPYLDIMTGEFVAPTRGTLQDVYLFS